MRPNAEEVLRGVQASLLAYVLPELQTEYARQELMIIYALLGLVGAGWDTGAQHLLEDNSSLRELARRAAGALPGGAVADELRALAAEEPSLLLSQTAAANAKLDGALARVAALAAPELRSEIIDWLRANAESRAFALLGSRADG